MNYLSINITIIAHVDHGKTTFLNYLINFCKNYNNFKKKFFFKYNNFYTTKCNLFSVFNKKKIFNFIDCPGHYDYINDIYKSIFISEYCFILIDLFKGIESQTLFCYNLAKKNNKNIFIFINKIDYYFKIKKIKNIIKNFNKKKIFFISSKYKIGCEKIFLVNFFFINLKNKIIFILDQLLDNKLGIILIIKNISGYLKINDVLVNKIKENIKILKIGFFFPKNFFLKKTLFNSLHFIIVDNYNFFKKNNFYYSKYYKSTIYKFSSNLFYNIYLKNDFFLFKLFNNDSSIFLEKKNSKIFGIVYFIGFIGNLHCNITFKKLKILSLFWFSNPLLLFLLNKKYYWYFEYDIDYSSDNYEQIMIVKIYVLKKFFFEILKIITKFSYYKIKVFYLSNLVIIVFYINLYKIINNFFNIINKIINGFIFYEFCFHHFLKNKLFIIEVYINNDCINELKFISEKLKEDCELLFKKIKLNLKSYNNNIKVQFFLKSKIIFTKKILLFKKNVLEKCSGGDITRKKKLIKKQNKGKKNNFKKKINIKKTILENIIKK